jgi:MEMO1 family protein
MVRKRVLPSGWYPDTDNETKKMIKEWDKESTPPVTNGVAGVVPHAGWFFSGSLAFRAFQCLDKEISTVVIIGGHLPKNGGILAAKDAEYETPLGNILLDETLLQSLSADLEIKEDVFADNTVEIQLPIVKYLFPESKLLWLRAEPTMKAVDLGKTLAHTADKLNRTIAVIGSSDLTHYGLSYGFNPKGNGEEAYRWVTEDNDKKMVDLLLSFDFESAIDHAVTNKAACSPGGAVAAGAFARERYNGGSILVDYYTSRVKHKAESFVGYAGIVYTESSR